MEQSTRQCIFPGDPIIYWGIEQEWIYLAFILEMQIMTKKSPCIQRCTPQNGFLIVIVPASFIMFILNLYMNSASYSIEDPYNDNTR